MTEIEIIKLLIQGIPNFLGFVLLAVYLGRIVNQLMGLVADCVDKLSDDSP